MKNFLFLIVAVFLFFVFGFVVFAQQSPTYTVQPGDKLWELSKVKLNDPFLWKKIVEQNQFLQQPGRQFERNGKIIVLIKPGEELLGLEKLGIIPNPVSLTQLQQASQASSQQALQQTATPAPTRWWEWLLALVVLAAILFLAYHLIRSVIRWRLKDPASSGPPIVEGGISSNEPDRLRQEFQRMAQHQELAASGHRRQTGEPVAVPTLESFQIIGDIETGTLNGYGRVRYGDGREELKRLDGEPAYRSRVRFPDGHEEILDSLQRCFNPVRRGMRLLGFEFRLTGQVAGTATPVQPEPVVVQAVSATSTAVGPAVNLGIDRITVVIDGRPVVFGVLAGYTVGVGVNGEVVINQPSSMTAVVGVDKRTAVVINSILAGSKRAVAAKKKKSPLKNKKK